MMINMKISLNLPRTGFNSRNYFSELSSSVSSTEQNRTLEQGAALEVTGSITMWIAGLFSELLQLIQAKQTN